MIKISKQNNSLIVEGIDNVFYPNNGDNSYPLNSLIVVTDNSDMATFRSVATNDVLFSGLINNITINGEAVTKDNIIQKFDAVSNEGTVDAYTKEEADNKFASKDELTNVQTVANDADTKVDALTPRVEGIETTLGNKQDTLVSGTNIKTINNQSILGEGNLEVSGDVDLTNYYTKTEADEIFATTTQVNHQAADISALQTDMRGKQATLVSGENIKTINSQSILGSGDLTISGVSEEQAQEIAKIPTLETELSQKANVSDVPTVQTSSAGTNKNYVYSEKDGLNYKGVMSKLEVYTNNAENVTLAYNLWGSRARYLVGLPNATTSKAGVMSAADKTKLDSIPETIPSQSEIDGIAANVSALQTDMMSKQDTLVSGTNIKTINNQSILGEGNLEISGDVDLTNYYTKPEADGKFATITGFNEQAADISALQTAMDGKQPTLVSGTNIKTINGESVLGEGNIEVAKKTDIPSTDNLATKDELTTVETVANNADAKADAATSRIESVETTLGNKQDTLVSGTNIKTVNSQSILGEGNLEITGGVSEEQAQEIAKIPTLETEIAQKANVSDIPTVQTGKEGTNKNYIYSTPFDSNYSVYSDFTFRPNEKGIQMVSDYWGSNHNRTSNFQIPLVTTSENGVMSAVDKTKLDSIPETIPSQSEIDGIAANVSTLETSLGNKQDILVSGTNIKTINSQSILGSGDLTISGVSDEQAQEIAKIPTIETELAQKANASDVPTVQTDGEGTNKNYIYSSPLDTNHAVYSRFTFKPNEKGIKMEADCWGSNHNRTFLFQIPLVTTSENGVMAAADKTKLDSISTEWTGTQSEYDALTTKDNNTIYYVTE